ncbi:hypothetical protein CRG98_012463 [Punica granatum]|uniref:Uncharacterized protein n=1 Tax=Punica granatum TaxID=22663 RepID=A0A2I0KF50_PUNGR|nr:hypothetical protein CRG98_012463 [Punica granatum]
MTGIALIGSRCRCHCAEERPIGEPRDPDALIPPLMKLLMDVLSRYVEKSGELTLDGANSVPWKLNTACSGSQNSVVVLKKIQSTGVSVNITISPMMPRMNARSTGQRVLQMRMMSCLGGVIASSLKPGAGRSILT